MSDTDDLDIGDGESPEASSAPKKKKGGLGALLPTILKFAAIGIGALIFIVTVSVITVNVVNKGGKAQTQSADPSSPYIGRRPIYSWYTDIGQVNTRTRDVTTSHTVMVVMNIGFDRDDAAASGELSQRKNELQEFVRRYFAGKYAAELGPENEERLKQEIKNHLNTRLLDTARVREIAFITLNVNEVY
ncbi:MAG: flagellar basal body-associated FliL family protein [Treponema sp.]|nr:flagellar basal body-associated FliL family protein [Treponema sp.]